MKTANPKITHILDKHIASDGNGKSGGAIYRSLIDNASNDELLLPVLGLQGVGKSSLINAILGECVLPNEADETTCVPVEIRYDEQSVVVSDADVFFKNGNKSTSSIEALKDYVDNTYNPGNEKQVERIVIRSSSKLLKSGIVLVDLPGVGSLTTANRETTEAYIEKLSYAIFVIHVNPPITKTEAAFIRMAWSKLANAFFVQNLWHDESAREANEGKEHNTSVLNNIAAKSHTLFSGKVLTVNAYDALLGIRNNDSASIGKSGITDFIDTLVELSNNWKSTISDSVNSAILGLFARADEAILTAIDNRKMSRDELQKQVSEKDAKFRSDIREIEDKVSDIDGLLIEQNTEATSVINKTVQNAEENIRSNIFRIIDSGVTDGDDLSRAFTDVQSEEFRVVGEAFNDFLREKVYAVTDKLQELGDLLEEQYDFGFEGARFEKSKEFKWEKGADFAVKIGGGLGGLAATWAVAGAVAGPIGMVVGTVGGLLIGWIGSKLGEGIHKGVSSSRASDTKNKIRNAIDESCEGIKKGLKRSYSKMCSDIEGNLNSIVESLKSKARKEHDDAVSVLRSTGNPEAELKTLSEDLAYIEEERKRYV
ncbi:hypothetical protein FACS1894167_11180 [Synergistales bacterium]|nr:hypothetical protein FACS1894167_11180 [Synergistales bacterium]